MNCLSVVEGPTVVFNKFSFLQIGLFHHVILSSINLRSLIFTTIENPWTAKPGTAETRTAQMNQMWWWGSLVLRVLWFWLNLSINLSFWVSRVRGPYTYWWTRTKKENKTKHSFESSPFWIYSICSTFTSLFSLRSKQLMCPWWLTKAVPLRNKGSRCCWSFLTLNRITRAVLQSTSGLWYKSNVDHGDAAGWWTHKHLLWLWMEKLSTGCIGDKKKHLHLWLMNPKNHIAMVTAVVQRM